MYHTGSQMNMMPPPMGMRGMRGMHGMSKVASSKKKIIAVVLVLLLVGGAAGWWFFIRDKKKPAVVPDETDETDASSPAVPTATVATCTGTASANASPVALGADCEASYSATVSAANRLGVIADCPGSVEDLLTTPVTTTGCTFIPAVTVTAAVPASCTGASPSTEWLGLSGNSAKTGACATQFSAAATKLEADCPGATSDALASSTTTAGTGCLYTAYQAAS